MCQTFMGSTFFKSSHTLVANRYPCAPTIFTYPIIYSFDKVFWVIYSIFSNIFFFGVCRWKDQHLMNLVHTIVGAPPTRSILLEFDKLAHGFSLAYLLSSSQDEQDGHCTVTLACNGINTSSFELHYWSKI